METFEIAMLLDYVRELEGISDIERRNLILRILKEIGYSYKLEKYSHLGKEGVNIVISIGKGKQVLAVTHYDVVPGSPGANDNCSTIAVMFDVLKKLKAYKPKGKIRLIMFGNEETGCVGSRAYVKRHGVKDIKAVYNMELVGMGDMIGIWPVTEQTPALENLRKTIKRHGYYHEETGRLPMFFGDYLPFKKAGVDAYCISVVFKKDKETLRKFVETPSLLVMPRFIFGRIPRMFRLYHSPEDKSKYLNESALTMTSDVLYNAMVSMDKARANGVSF